MAADSADTRLAVYGTLAPGQPNHHQLDGLTGRWRKGRVRGSLVDAGLGHKALLPEADGPVVAVDLFESADLPRHWARLDAFEGEAYRRALARVETDDGHVEAWIYVGAGPER